MEPKLIPLGNSALKGYEQAAFNPQNPGSVDEFLANAIPSGSSAYEPTMGRADATVGGSPRNQLLEGDELIDPASDRRTK